MENRKSIFNRHPGTSITIIVIVMIIVIDIVAGLLLIKDDQASFRKRHPVYHHGMYPDQNSMTGWGHLKYRMVTNSLGFRDSEIRDIPLKLKGRKRLLLMGDSYTEGLGVAYEKSFGGIVAGNLQEKGIEVLNAAAVSYSPKLYFLKTKYLIENVGLEFDEMIVFIDISDIQDEITYTEFDPKPDEKEFSTELTEFFDEHSFFYHSISNLLTRDERISNQMRRAGNAHIDVWYGDLKRYRNNPDPERGRFNWTVDSTVFTEWGAKGLELAADHMSRLVKLCRNNGIEVAVAVYPSPVQIFAKDRNSIQVRFWKTFAEKQDILFINLFPLFVNEQPPGIVYEKFFIQGDTHWNEKGHSLVASKVLTFIEKSFMN